MYWLIEPEISKSATIGGSFSRGPRYFRSITAPPAFMLARKVRRMSIRCPRRLARQPPRAHQVERQRQPRDRLLGGGDLGRGHLREILLLQHFAVGHGQPRVDLDFGLVLALVRARRTAPPGCAARPAAALSARRRGVLRQHRGDQLFDIAALAEENAEGLVEQHRVLVPLHEHRVQRPVEILAVADARDAHALPAHRARAGPDRNAGRAQRAREVEDVFGEAALCRPWQLTPPPAAPTSPRRAAP